MVLNPGPSSAVALRVQTAATLRHETDGLHIDQSEAFLWCLKLATTYENEAIVIEAGQGSQAAPGGESVARVDVGDGAADDQPCRVRQHEAGDGEGFISERFWVPERRVAEFFNRS